MDEISPLVGVDSSSEALDAFESGDSDRSMGFLKVSPVVLVVVPSPLLPYRLPGRFKTGRFNWLVGDFGSLWLPFWVSAL